MEGTWTIEPPRLAIGAAERMGRGGEGRGGRGGRACGTYPAKSAEGQSSPLREEEKEKEKRDTGISAARRSSEQHRAEAGSRFCHIQHIPACAAPEDFRSRQGGDGNAVCPGPSASQPVTGLRGLYVAKHFGGK